MTNKKVVRNVIVNENYYDIFPLAAIFGTPYIWEEGEKFRFRNFCSPYK